MEAREFKGQNVIFAEHQEEYSSLPALLDREQGTAMFSFKLSEEEIKQVIETGTVYLTILTFNKSLQPIGPSLMNPFVEIKK